MGFDLKPRTTGMLSLAASTALASTVAAGARGDITFSDQYSTDSTANYIQVDEAGPKSSWTVANGTLNYKQADTNWHSSLLLLNSNVASTAGLTRFTVSGDIIGDPKSTVGSTGLYYQPGLVLSGDPIGGGFVVEQYDVFPNGPAFSLLQESGAELLSDEGGNPQTQPGQLPVVARFGRALSGMRLNDNFHVSALVDRTGPNPIFTITITDMSIGKDVVTNEVVTDTAVPSGFGGTQVGWRARYYDASANFSVDNLALSSDVVPEPSSLGVLMSSGLVLARRRRRNPAARLPTK